MALFVLSFFVWIVVRGRLDDYSALIQPSTEAPKAPTR